MATFHCSVKAGNSGSGGAHADYIERDGKYKSKSKDDLEHTETGNLPKFAETSREFWSAADKGEGDKKSPYREYEIALPRELTKEQRLELVREFVKQEIGDKYTYTFAIHNPAAAIDGGEQPHAHIMFSERIIDGIDRPAEQYFKRWNAKNPEKGGCKKGNNDFKTATERKAELVNLRERFASLQNKHLTRYGHSVQVTHLSLKAQGIDREVEPHLGPNRAKVLASAVKADRAAEQINHRTEVKHETRPLRNHQLRGEISSLHDVSIRDVAHVTDAEHFTSITSLHLPSAEQIDLRERQAHREPMRGMDTEERLKPVKTASEAVLDPKPPNPTPAELQAALDVFKHVRIALERGEMERSRDKRLEAEALHKAREQVKDSEGMAKVIAHQNDQLGKRPLFGGGKWDKDKDALRAQFAQAKASHIKALESVKELEKKAQTAQAQPSLDQRMKAAIESLKLPYTQQTLDQIQLGAQVLKERQQAQEQARSVSQAKPKEQGFSR